MDEKGGKKGRGRRGRMGENGRVKGRGRRGRRGKNGGKMVGEWREDGG